jgi:hypothetical protein
MAMKAMKKKPIIKQKGGTVPGSKRTVSKPKSKRRTVKVNTVKPARGTVGGTPTTTKTVTKRKKSGKIVTKTKSINNPMNPMAKSTVRKTKSVTKKGSNSMMPPSMNRKSVSSKSSSKSVSRKRGAKMQSRMQKRKGATTTTRRSSRRY